MAFIELLDAAWPCHGKHTYIRGVCNRIQGCACKSINMSSNRRQHVKEQVSPFLTGGRVALCTYIYIIYICPFTHMYIYILRDHHIFPAIVRAYTHCHIVWYSTRKFLVGLLKLACFKNIPAKFYDAAFLLPQELLHHRPASLKEFCVESHGNRAPYRRDVDLLRVSGYKIHLTESPA